MMKRLALGLGAIFVAVTGTVFGQANGLYLYGINTGGNVSVNGNKINELKTNFDPENPEWNTQEAWRDLAIDDGDQYALRGDGLLMRNGEKLAKLSANDFWWWIDLEVVDGTVYALRQDGHIAVNENVVDSVPRDAFGFTSLQVHQGMIYTLRSDGRVFRNGDSNPLFKFRGPDGLFGGDDGEELDTAWMRLRVSPDGDFLYALRADGRIMRGELPDGDEDGEDVNQLPFPDNVFEYSFPDLYSDLEFDDVTEQWVALRIKGQVFREPAPLAATDDFPGGNDEGELFMDLAVHDGRYFALRSDGKVFVQGSDEALLNLGGAAYGRLVPSVDLPVLVGQKNNEPDVVTYTVTLNTGGDSVLIPVVATDVETATEDLVVTPISLPPGGVWNPTARTLAWASPAEKGNATFEFKVDDGDGSAKTYTSKLTVKDRETTEKNKAPYAPKLSGTVALVGEEYRLHLPLSDPDGDPVTVTVNPSTYPFSVGASYEPLTREFVWTPVDADLGKHDVQFELSDGLATTKLKLKIEVKSPLFIPPLFFD